jgi:hypothetical protein
MIRRMSLATLVKKKQWKEIEVDIDGEKRSFAVFPWAEVKEREQDGAENVWEYFIGFDGPVYDKVDSGEWTPFGAGEMDPGALEGDGGFQEMSHRGMLFAAGNGAVFFYDHNDAEAGAKPLKVKIDEL